MHAPLGFQYSPVIIHHSEFHCNNLTVFLSSVRLCLSLDVVELLFDVLPADRSRGDNGLQSRHPLLGDLSQIIGHFFG